MNKSEAMNIINSISEECNNSSKCTECAFSDIGKNIDGCIFDRLVHLCSPGDFKNVLKNDSDN